MSWGQDQGLAHHKKEYPAQQGQDQDDDTKKQKGFTEYLIDDGLPIKAIVQSVQVDVLFDQVKSFTDDLCRQNSEVIGYNYEYHTWDYAPTIFIEKFIEVW